MTQSPLVRAIRERLRCANYVDLSIPFKVAGVEFSFSGAMHGSDGRALDLVLLIDTVTGDFGDRDGRRVRQKVEALSRALDVTGSRYVVTVILAGPPLANGGVEVLPETCRVLHVESIELNDSGELVDQAAQCLLEDRIRVLLPLLIPAPITGSQGEGVTVMDQLIRALPAGTSSALIDALIDASSDGELAVLDTVVSMTSRALQSSQNEGLS
ncbi:hypothetical protein G8764_04290 [Pseudomaricurvus alcaniphilus]|uniref:hypothetical protein n=1 Tax=Pseudomaricurvus alcaniphilus TaxID=1166482 RepID=UPI001408305C|nr:hypothetical protein [Pseudomaricurvus alcaniphilus]NHN36507.1 hypothetical protein [Pseudomaricurvus alcaniphilus]